MENIPEDTTAEQCRNCRFFAAYQPSTQSAYGGGLSHDGQCQFLPPEAGWFGNKRRPETNFNSTCREFKSKYAQAEFRLPVVQNIEPVKSETPQIAPVEPAKPEKKPKKSKKSAHEKHAK